MRAPVISAREWAWVQLRCPRVWVAEAAQAVRAVALLVRLPVLRRAQQAVEVQLAQGQAAQAQAAPPRVLPEGVDRVADAAVGTS